MGHSMRLGSVIPLIGFASKVPKASAFLRHLSLKIANSGLSYTGREMQNQQIATSKEMMKDCLSEVKFCCLKSKLICFSTFAFF